VAIIGDALSSLGLESTINKYSPYLMEARKRIFFTASIFVIGLIVGFAFCQPIIKILVSLLSLDGVNIVFTSPFQFINLSISCGFVTGLIFIFPLVLAQFISFLKPALRPKEYKMVKGLLPFSILLFVLGFTFGALIMKWQIKIFLTQSIGLGIGNLLDIVHLLQTVIITSALMGVAFEFPVVLLILLHLKVIKPNQLSKQRPWVFLGSFIFALLLPPDSILADILLALPLVILFEITLILDKLLQKTKAGREILEGS
jgi:sec-independent protein translocase protein TatC